VTVYPAQGEAVAALLGCADERAALDEALERWARERGPEEAAALLQRIGVAAAPVLNVRDLLLNPQLGHRGAFPLVRHDQAVNGYAAHPHAASPFLARGRSRPELNEAPASGQDSRALLRELLRMTDGEIDALLAEGVIAELGPPATGGHCGRIWPAFSGGWTWDCSRTTIPIPVARSA